MLNFELNLFFSICAIWNNVLPSCLQLIKIGCTLINVINMTVLLVQVLKINFLIFILHVWCICTNNWQRILKQFIVNSFRYPVLVKVWNSLWTAEKHELATFIIKEEQNIQEHYAQKLLIKVCQWFQSIFFLGYLVSKFIILFHQLIKVCSRQFIKVCLLLFKLR